MTKWCFRTMGTGAECWISRRGEAGGKILGEEVLRSAGSDGWVLQREWKIIGKEMAGLST